MNTNTNKNPKVVIGCQVGDIVLTGKPYNYPDGHLEIVVGQGDTKVAFADSKPGNRLVAVVCEGPLKTSNDTVFRVLPIRIGIGGSSVDESDEKIIITGRQRELICCFWAEYPVSLAQFIKRLSPLRDGELEKLLVAREKYRAASFASHMNKAETRERLVYMEKIRWLSSVADYRLYMAQDCYEARN